MANMFYNSTNYERRMNHFTVDKTKYTYYTDLGSSEIEKIGTLTNYKNRYMLYKGTEDKPYEQYGASPSPDYPSEIETAKDSVEIDVVNKNLFPSVKSQSVESNGITLSYNADTQEFHAEGTTTSTKFFCIIRLEELKFLQQNKNYVFSITKQMISNTSIQLTKYGVLANSNIDTGQTSEAITQLDIAKPDAIMLYSNDAIVGTKIDYTFKVQIEEGITATNIVEHQSQTAIMPVQQEMLTGDYISSVEHHEWEKLVLTGEGKWERIFLEKYAFVLPHPASDSIQPIWGKRMLQVCSHFKVGIPGYDRNTINCFSFNASINSL